MLTLPSPSTARDSIMLHDIQSPQGESIQKQKDAYARQWASEVVKLTEDNKALREAGNIKAVSELLGFRMPIRLDNLDKLNSLRTGSTFLKPDPAQCIFLCMRGNDGERFAVQVSCYRPTAKRRIRVRSVRMSKYHSIEPGENVCESDSIIYDRLRDTCFEHQGNWKRWIPFYGIVDVREVQIQFTRTRAKTLRLPVKVYALDIEGLQRDLEATSRIPDYEYDYDHFRDTKGYEVAEEEIKQAQNGYEYLNDLHLLRDYMRNPRSATAHVEESNRSTLEGLAQRSPILEKNKIDIHNRWKQQPALQVVLGWQVKELRTAFSRLVILIASIWIVVVILGVAIADWSLAVGLGQLVAASVAILYVAVEFIPE